MSSFRVIRTFPTLSLLTLGLLGLATTVRAQEASRMPLAAGRVASRLPHPAGRKATPALHPVGYETLTPASPSLLPCVVACPNGKLASVNLRRLPASAVVREDDPSVTALLGRGRANPADAEVYNAQLNYSRRTTPETLWLFPTRGYDLNHYPQLNVIRPMALISPVPPFRGSDGKMHDYTNFGAAVELLQLGQSVLLSSIRETMDVYRQMPGDMNNGFKPVLVESPAGGEVAILFWDGVYNDTVNGLPTTNFGDLKLAYDSNGASGVIVQLPPGGGSYLINFDADGQGGFTNPNGRFKITDPKGRMGLTIAAYYDSSAGVDDDNNPLSTPTDGVVFAQGAPVGQNKYYLISKANLAVPPPVLNSDGQAPVNGNIQFDSADPDSDIFYTDLTRALDGSHVFQIAPADTNFNVTELLDDGTQTGTSRPIYYPFNSSTTLYGTKSNGTTAVVGELRGLIRRQGYDPDNNRNVTLVTSPYDATMVPGERKANRFRFTFIKPVLNSADLNPNVLFDPTSQLPAKYTFFQQETYAMPSYGDNGDYVFGGTLHGSSLTLNYRLRGIPVGTYSVLVQAIPIVGVLPGNPAKVVSDMATSYNQFPGSDYMPYFVQSLTIGESKFVAPSMNPNDVDFTNYSNPTVLNLKVRHLADIAGGPSDAPDGLVDISDFGMIINQFGDGPFTPGAEVSDFGGGLQSIPDGLVDSGDFGILVNNFDFGDGSQEPESVGY